MRVATRRMCFRIRTIMGSVCRVAIYMWYATKNRFQEMKEAEKKISWLSGISYVEREDRRTEKIEEKDTKVYTIRDLFSSWPIAYSTIVVGSLWFSTSVSSFGADLNSGNLAGNFYLSQFVQAAAIALSKLSIFLLDLFIPSFNRQRLHQVPQIIMIACYTTIMALMISPDSDCSSQGSRNLASIGTCSLLARIGALLAPQMAYLSEIYPPIPYIIVCSIGIISLLISCFFLPDTKGVDLGALDRNPLEESGDNKEEEISAETETDRNKLEILCRNKSENVDLDETDGDSFDRMRSVLGGMNPSLGLMHRIRYREK
nr:protein F23F12.1 [imported] - Caenorhabditis elegans [Caenorhabditis elegans]